MVYCRHMRRAVSVLLLSTLLAPLFPVRLMAQEVGSTTPSSESVLAPIAEFVPDEVNIHFIETPNESVFTPEFRDGVSTTPQFVEENPTRAMREPVSRQTGFLQDSSILHRQISSYSSNGTVAIGVKSFGTFEYQAGVSYTPDISQNVEAVGFIIGRSGDRTGHIHAEIWHKDIRIAISEDRAASEFKLYSEINSNQEGFESGLVTFAFATPVSLVAGQNYQIVAGAGDDLSGYLDTWASFTPATYPVAQQSYGNVFREMLNANFTLYGTTSDTTPCIENCSPNVLFLPGIEGSALKEGGNILWPSSVLSGDGERLRLTNDGESVNDVKVAGVIGEFVPGVDVYGGFAAYMDGLVQSQVINEWVPFAYDWRLALDKTLEEGVEEEGDTELVRLSDEIERLASTSKNGKVAIVGHSMGGLLGKLLIKKLESEGKTNLIDTFIMVGTPQLGTPEAISALLHGDQPVSMGLFMRSHAFRSIARNMGSAYMLLPSDAYMATSAISPVITFDSNAAFTEVWRNRWAMSIDSSVELREFLSGTGVTRVRPNETNLAQPEVLRTELLDATRTLHDGIDTFAYPANIRVVQIAGWGKPTVKSLHYNTKHLLFNGYETRFSVEGDATVVYSSALVGSTEKYYFNLATYNSLENQPDFQHRNLTSAAPIQSIITSVLQNEPIANAYVTTEKPDPGNAGDQLLVVTKSPVVIGAYDALGNFSGIDSTQDLAAEALKISENIPGSSFVAAGGDMYLFLPKNGSYTFVFKGTGVGPATVEIGTLSNDVVHAESSYTDIPVTPNTQAAFSINSGALKDVFIEVDSNGDGQSETTVAPDDYVPPPPPAPTIGELILNLKSKVQSLNISVKLKNNLIKRIEQLEKKIEKQKKKNTKILDRFVASILIKTEKGKINSIAAADIFELLDELESSIVVHTADSIVLEQLRTKIAVLDTSPKIKSELLKRTERLEKVDGLCRALAKNIDGIARKGAAGKISDADVQELLSLLENIESAL